MWSGLVGVMALGVIAAALHWPIDDRAIARVPLRQARARAPAAAGE